MRITPPSIKNLLGKVALNTQMTHVEDHFREIGKLICILRAIVSSACSHFNFALMATEAFSQNTGQKRILILVGNRETFLCRIQ